MRPCPFCCSACSVIKWALAHNSIRKAPPPSLNLSPCSAWCLNTFSSPDTCRASVTPTKSSSVGVSASIDFPLQSHLLFPLFTCGSHLGYSCLSTVLSMRMTPLGFELLLSLNLPGTKPLCKVQWGHFLSGILCCLSTSSEYLSLKPGFPTS